jgi:hypothetical protein
MARYFNGGTAAMDPERVASLTGIDEDDKDKIRTDTTRHHKLTKPHRDNLALRNGQQMLKVPPLFWRRQMLQTQDGRLVDVIDPDSQFTPWEPGSVTLSLVGYGFWVVFPGGSVDLPSEISEKTVRDSAPHLVNEAEAMALGIGPFAPVKQKSPPVKAQ